MFHWHIEIEIMYSIKCGFVARLHVGPFGHGSSRRHPWSPGMP